MKTFNDIKIGDKIFRRRKKTKNSNSICPVTTLEVDCISVDEDTGITKIYFKESLYTPRLTLDELNLSKIYKNEFIYYSDSEQYIESMYKSLLVDFNYAPNAVEIYLQVKELEKLLEDEKI